MGASAQIFYDPANPKEAILEREPISLTAERLGCLAIFVVAVALFLTYGLTPLHKLVRHWFPNAKNENILVVTSALGAWFVLFGLVRLRQGKKEHTWPVATGTVVSSGVKASAAVTGGGSNAPQSKMYQSAGVYTYDVGGRRYQCARIAREKKMGSQTFAERAAAKYAVGSTVNVFYNPSNPADAVPETSAAFGLIVLWGTALVMFAVAALMSGYFRRT